MKLLLDINEVADAIGVSRRTAYTLRANPNFPKPVPLSAKCIRYRSSELAAFVESLTPDAAPTPEPSYLKSSKKGRKPRNGGTSGGKIDPLSAHPCTTLRTAEGLSVELENAAEKAAA